MNVEGVKLGAKIISSSINIPSAKFEPTLGIKIDSTLGIKIEPQKEKKNKKKIKYIYHLVNLLFLELILCFYWIDILAWNK